MSFDDGIRLRQQLTTELPVSSGSRRSLHSMSRKFVLLVTKTSPFTMLSKCRIPNVTDSGALMTDRLSRVPCLGIALGALSGITFAAASFIVTQVNVNPIEVILIRSVLFAALIHHS